MEQYLGGVSAGCFRASNQTFDDSVVFQLFNIAQLRLRPSERPAPTRTDCLSNYTLHTLTRASVRLVHMAISSRTAMSGYRFLENIASSS